MKKNNFNIVLGITGSIAAYKAAEVISLLKKNNISTNVIMTKNATEFVSPLTFETVTSNPVAVDMFEKKTNWDVEHISLAKKADLFVVAPASANFIAKLAHGIADDMLTTTAMATKAKILIAPAMNSAMYLSQANTNNMKILKQRGCSFVEPKSGMLACNDIGIGKLANPSDIVDKILELLNINLDLTGRNVLITAGPTREYIDPVRYITNKSSGKMGYAIAQAAKNRGANVTLITGPVNINKIDGIKMRSVETTKQMFDAVKDEFDNNEIVIKAAAPADYTIKNYSEKKIKKHSDDLSIELIKTQDILAYLGKNKGDKFLCGFAAETNELENYALDKLKRKNVDMIVANDVSAEGAGFDVDTNIATLFFRSGEKIKLDIMAKSELADVILTQICKRLK